MNIRRRLSLSKQIIQRTTAVVLLGGLPIMFGGCPKNDPPTGPRVGIGTAPTKGLDPTTPIVFSGERAMAHVKKQLDIGPRPPDTPALERTRAYIISELKSYGLSVSTDEFSASTPQGEKKMANIVAEIPGETKDMVLITSHYDSKYFADMRFVGANDPATSVATLLEIARVLSHNTEKPKVTFRLVFFDGEEAFCENWEDCGKPDAPDNTYGSRHYVSTLKTKDELSHTRALILLDMMGAKNLELGRDTTSTKWLQDIIWETGRALGYANIFVDREEGVGGDDHESFLKAGVDSVDIIQLTTYQYWHRADDTIDKVSAQSMKIVGDTVLASLPKIATRVATK